MIYFIIAIIIFTFISIYLIRDIANFLKFISIILIISGYITIIFNYFLRIVINKKISFINVSKITDIVYTRIRDRGLILILVGGIELIIYIIMLYKKDYSINVNIKEN